MGRRHQELFQTVDFGTGLSLDFVFLKASWSSSLPSILRLSPVAPSLLSPSRVFAACSVQGVPLFRACPSPTCLAGSQAAAAWGKAEALPAKAPGTAPSPQQTGADQRRSQAHEGLSSPQGCPQRWCGDEKGSAGGGRPRRPADCCLGFIKQLTAELKSSKRPAPPPQPPPDLAFRRSFPNSAAQGAFLQHLSQGYPPLTDFTLRRRSRTLRQGCLGVAVLGVGGEDLAVCMCIVCILM